MRKTFGLFSSTYIMPLVYFYPLLKTSEIFWFSDVFRGYVKRPATRKGFTERRSQPAITCSMLAIGTLEQGVKYAQS